MQVPNSFAPESNSVQRSREKLLRQFEQESKQVTPGAIEEAKKRVTEGIARRGDRVSVDGAVFKDRVTTVKFSPQVEALMRKVTEAVAPPVA